jgi:predicted transcriptional regulator of viral defense system
VTDPKTPSLLLRSTALSEGVADDELARLVRRRELVRLQRGAYLTGVSASPGDRQRAVIEATTAGLRAGGVVGHASAAVLHGLPLWRVPLTRVHLIRPPGSPGSRSSRLHLHLARVGDDELTTVDGMVLTDVTRTVVDLARTQSFESAVVLADAALARQATTAEDLAERLLRMGPVPGSRAAARVIAFADRRSESVGESRSRVLLHHLGIPAPDLQVRVFGEDGTSIGRCDFGWEEHRTVGEFDGRIKYGRLLRPGQSPGDAVYEEKLREDAIRDTGRQVTRWTWRELDAPTTIHDRIQRAFLRGRR